MAQQFLLALKSGSWGEVEAHLQKDPQVAGLTDPVTRAEPAQIARYAGNKDVADSIVDTIPSPSLAALIAAGRLDQMKAEVARLISGANTLTPDGFTPLSLAAAFGELEIVRLLLVWGADPNRPSVAEGGIRPLDAAVSAGDLAIAKLLLANQADPNLRSTTSLTPLHRAAFNGDRAMIELLLEARASTEVQCTDGLKPYHIAAERGFGEILPLL